jgi:RHS repeat-associated protein
MVQGGGSGVTPLFPDPGLPPTTQVPLPYSANGFRYNVVPHAAFPTFADPSFDDTGPDWRAGNAPFGTAGACSVGSRIRTAWALDMDLLLRTTLAVQIGQSYEVAVAVDNDVQVFWNGTPLTPDPIPHENCPVEDTFVFAVPANLVTSTGVLLGVRAIDHGIEDFADVSVRIRALGAAPDQRFGRCGPDPEQNVVAACQAEPVNTFSGAYTNTVADLQLPGRGLALDFTRQYSSLDTASGPLGPGWHHAFEQHLILNGDGSITLTDANGNAIPYLSDGNGGTYRASGVRATLSTVQGGGYRVERPDLVADTFDVAGRLTAEIDRNGNQISFAYTASDLTTITDTVGRTVTLGYDPTSHRLTSVQDPLGHQVVYTYDPNGRLATVKDLSNGVTTYAYDPAGRLASILDPNSHFLMRTTYGTDGRVSQQLDARGNPTTFAWDAPTRTSTMTDARGGAWVDIYNADGSLASKRDPLNNTTGYTYDAQLNVLTVSDPRGHVTTMSYDGRGHLLKSVASAPFGYVTSYEYDEHGNRHRTTDGRGFTTWLDYNATNNLSRITLPLSGSPMETFAYDPSGNGLLISTTDFRGKTTTYGYDAQANPNRITSPLGFKLTSTYDADGRMLTRVDPRGNVTGGNPAQYTTTFTYDGLGRVLTVTDPLSHTTTTVYDPAGNRQTVTDANLHMTAYGYDDANELTSVTDPRTKVTSYAYDAVGNLATRTDANLHVTSYGYDLARRKTSETRPLNRLWTYAYDAAGNRTQIVDAIGNSTPQTGDGTTTFAYDNLDRLSGIAYSDTTPAITLVYDGDSNRSQMTDPAITTYAYDEMNRPTSVIRATSQRMDYTYDANGNVLSRIPAGGSAVLYTYDDDSRMATELSAGQTTTYGYDAAANPTTTTLPSGNGYVESRTYDTAGRLTEVKNQKGATVLSKSTYTLDPVGNRSTIVSTTGTTTLTYDPDDRLTQACYTTACTGLDNFRRYTYDDVGNRLTEVSASGTTTSTYDALDQLVGSSGVGGNISYTFNFDGNQTAAGTQTFTYDLANRLKTTTASGTTTTYTYDGDGRRVQASTGAQANKNTKFVWDTNRPVAQLVRELDGNNTMLREYQYGRDLVSMKSGGSSFYFHHDGLGSVANLTSSTGVTQWTYDYHPYGVTRTTIKNNNQAPTNLIQFAGEYLDPTGLYHLRARAYAPTTGRFLSTDPIRAAISHGATASYTYARNNPIHLVDPSGLESTPPSQLGQTSGGCLSAQGQVGIMGGAGFCIFGGHVQIQLQVGASSGVGGSVGWTNIFSDATSASQHSGLGAGFGGSAGTGLVVGGDRCFSISNGQTFNCVTQTTAIGMEVSPELLTPGEIHAYGSWTIDFNDLVASLVDLLP